MTAESGTVDDMPALIPDEDFDSDDEMDTRKLFIITFLNTPKSHLQMILS